MEEVLSFLNDLVVNVCQILATIVIFLGISKALIIYVKDIMLSKKSYEALQESRLEIGHAFSLGLAFLIDKAVVFPGEALKGDFRKMTRRLEFLDLEGRGGFKFGTLGLFRPLPFFVAVLALVSTLLGLGRLGPGPEGHGHGIGTQSPVWLGIHFTGRSAII